MFILLSPSKTLAPRLSDNCLRTTAPHFSSEAEEIMDSLKKWTDSELSSKMKLSPALTKKICKWHAAWGTQEYGTHAGFAMMGEAFKALDLDSFTSEDLSYASKKLYILSGVYGALSPCDLIDPYRLEMAQSFTPNQTFKSLNAYWSSKLPSYFSNLSTTYESEMIVNLASDEYSKVVLRKDLNARVLNFQFKVLKDGKLKNISVFSKQARGALARFIIQNRITDPINLKDFNYLDYRFNSELSGPELMTFIKTV
jgi:cytoplasmic iron level regulating protein YaaA (DUF328/UPF0246 family)